MHTVVAVDTTAYICGGLFVGLQRSLEKPRSDFGHHIRGNPGASIILITRTPRTEHKTYGSDEKQSPTADGMQIPSNLPEKGSQVMQGGDTRLPNWERGFESRVSHLPGLFR